MSARPTMADTAAKKPRSKKTAEGAVPDVAASPAETITTVKGFNTDLTCRNFQFEIGRTYTVSGKVKACENGFHACEYPLDCFNYYAPAGSRFFEVEQDGELSRHDADTKVASASITLKFELTISDLVARAFKYVWDRCTVEEGGRATGDQGAASATGDRGAASATGYQGAASATGYQGAASATGNRGAASATGDRGAASATGDHGAASATGDRGAASATGYQGAASATGKNSVAMASGFAGSASAVEGSAIFLVNRDEYSGEIRHVFAAKVGEHGIKAGVFYRLNDDGLPAEARS